MQDHESTWQALLDAASQHGGWVVAIMTATWGVVLRTVVGRYERNAADERARNAMIDQSLHNINERLSRIEGRFAERDRHLDDSDVR